MRWIIAHNGREFGPFVPDDLHNLVMEQKLKPTHQLRPENSNRLFMAHQLKGLFPNVPLREGEMPVDMETGFQPAPHGSFRPSDGYGAGVRRLAFSRYGLSAAILLGCLFAYRHHQKPVAMDIPISEVHDRTPDLQERIEQWKARREKLAALLSRLERDRTRLLEELRNLGISSAEDIRANPRAKVLAEELRDVLRQRGTCQRQVDQYDIAILKAESCLRTVARQRAAQEAGVSDGELNDLVRSVLVLDEKLSAKEKVPLELDDSLSKQFEKQKR